jgi:hypothetical protein
LKRLVVSSDGFLVAKEACCAKINAETFLKYANIRYPPIGFRMMMYPGAETKIMSTAGLFGKPHLAADAP